MHWWAGASLEDTAAELNRLLWDPEIRGIVALDGGRWVFGYLDLIDLEALRTDPKLIVGGSDISALLLALYGRIGLAGIHGDVAVRQFAEWDDLDPGRRVQLADAWRRVLTGDAPPVALPADGTWECWRSGRAEGPLIGAMLNRLVRVQASAWALAADRFDGAILFLEEAFTSTTTVWYDLHVLRSAGILDRIGGMLVGAPLLLDVQEGGPDLRGITLDLLGDRDIPVLGNVNIGHAGPNLPVPLGVRAEMNADALTLSLLEPAVSPI
jgi:muramoyltetrapeptide carboxypeptidase